MRWKQKEVARETHSAAEPDEYRLAWDDPGIPFNWDIEYK